MPAKAINAAIFGVAALASERFTSDWRHAPLCVSSPAPRSVIARAATSTWSGAPAATMPGVNSSTPVEDATPVPARAAVWGLPLAESVTLSFPVRAPAAVGVNVMLTVQAVRAGSAAGSDPHELEAAKSPDAVIAEIVRLSLPVLEIVIA